MDERDGVIRFRADHRVRALDFEAHVAVARSLLRWRRRLAKVGVVGADPARYQGAGFGNLSGRLPPFPGCPGARRFLVTGTQTGGHRSLKLADLCLVTRCDAERNRVSSLGLVKPSSESMTHGALYDADPTIRFVFHVHSPLVWERAQELRLPTTEAAAGYGTPVMCREVREKLADPQVREAGILVMGGHRDGLLCFGTTADEVGCTVLDLLERARCLGGGGPPHAGRARSSGPRSS